MQKVIDFINKRAIGSNVLLWFVIQLTIFAVFIGHFSPTFKKYSNGMETLDLTNFYSVAYVHQLFKSTSVVGLHYYLRYFSTLDLFYPAIYSFSYALIVAYLLKKLELIELKFQWLIVFPFISAFFDYLENFGMIYMILHQPDFSITAAMLTKWFSILKGGTAFTGMGILSVLIILLILKKCGREKLSKMNNNGP